METNVGFTGTQYGSTPEQNNALSVLFLYLKPNTFHHGDCIGADATAHFIMARKVGSCEPIIYPPLDTRKRAYCLSSKIYPPKPFLDRNKDIVNAITILVACPIGYTEELRSGTWSTIRYARKQKKLIYIVYPDGSIVKENSDGTKEEGKVKYTWKRQEI